ncbi:MAG: hypothetical protein DRQ44_15355, partial [Gammaproteobacteria bacterium]
MSFLISISQKLTLIVFRKHIVKNILLGILSCLLLSTSMSAFSASSEFISVESFVTRPADMNGVKSYAVNIISFTQPFNVKEIKNISALDNELVYVTKVKVNNVVYYRLVSGNFSKLKQAQQHLSTVKKYFPGAWINIRRKVERQELNQILTERIVLPEFKRQIVTIPPVVMPVVAAKVIPEIKIKRNVSASVTPETIAETDSEVVKTSKVIKESKTFKAFKEKTEKPPEVDFAEKLLEQAKQEFLDRNYARVITISNKVIEIGSVEQKQKAMEFAGIARERQRKFAQAVAIYSRFLDLYPQSKLASKINIRLTGLKTMRLDPKVRLAKKQRKKTDENWKLYGSLSQYYRNGVVDRTSLESKQTNSSLVSDVNLFARRITDKSVLVMRLDAGLVNDFIDKDLETRLSRAMINYTNNEANYQLIGGRQSRTAKGVLGRFDGIVYRGLSDGDFNYSVYTGFPVQSSYDGFNPERRFVGGSLHFKPGEKMEMDVYVNHQQISGLTDRQAIGTEFQYRNDNGLLFGMIDYDIFYNELNNITAISNYRYTDKLSFNVTYDYRNSPLLTTQNALQGLSVESIEALQNLFTNKEIYQLAVDRTTKGQNLFIGTNYQINDSRQLYLSMSLSSVEASVESAGVAVAPSTSDINLSADYSQKGLLFNDDY